MVELEPHEIAKEFNADSAHIKSFRQAPVTMETLEESRQAYLTKNPKWRNFPFEKSLFTKPAPTFEDIDKGTYLHDRWKVNSSQDISALDESSIH